jgi:hypothetical protein
MSRIFTPAADLWIRFAVVSGVCFALASVTLAIAWARSDFETGANLHPPPQPVPFSHKHHVAGLGLDCVYCHTSVANGPRAGIPATHICMTCHSQIWTGAPMLAPVRESLSQDRSLVWQRVARLPDYVYFRHDVHIAKGVGCVSCHGRIDEMALTYKAVPLTMQFCISCHRNPAPALRPANEITHMNWRPRGDLAALGSSLLVQNHIRVGELTDCSVCHR